MKKMNKLIAVLLLVLVLNTVSATEVQIAADKEILKVGETVHINLSLSSKEKITGQLTLINLDEKTQEKILFQSISPGCTCRSDMRVIGDYSDTLSYTPQKEGNFQARAYFDGVEKTVNFTVKPKFEHTTTTTTMPATTTTTTSSTTTSKTTTTTSTTSTTTTLIEAEPSTTTTISPTSLTVQNKTEAKSTSIFDRCPCEWAPFAIVFILVFLVLVDVIYKYIKGRK
jgi:hypothetical protein